MYHENYTKYLNAYGCLSFTLIVKVYIMKNFHYDFIMQEMNALDFREALKMHRQYLVTNSINHLSGNLTKIHYQKCLPNIDVLFG